MQPTETNISFFAKEASLALSKGPPLTPVLESDNCLEKSTSPAPERKTSFEELGYFDAKGFAVALLFFKNFDQNRTPTLDIGAYRLSYHTKHLSLLSFRRVPLAYCLPSRVLTYTLGSSRTEEPPNYMPHSLFWDAERLGLYILFLFYVFI